MRANRIILSACVAVLSIPWSRATLSKYLPPEGLAAAAPLVVEGTVSRTASGYDPVTSALATYVTVEIGFVHRGPADLDRVVLREPGGRFGDVVNEIDAVPVFEPGESVFLFLEPAGDGALRVAGMFYGKFTLLAQGPRGVRVARRNLSGSGTIPGPPLDAFEELPAGHLESLVAATPYSGPAVRRRARAAPAPAGGGRASSQADGWTAEPPEFDRLEWDQVREAAVDLSSISETAPRAPADVVPPGGGTDVPQFVPISTSSPTRWQEADSSTAISIQIQPTGNPMNNAAAAANEIKRGMAAWTNVPEARIVLQAGNENYDFTGANAQSPTAAYPPVNIVLFNDPYNEITDPSGCSGVLAVGGYWRSGAIGRTVNNVAFYPTLRQYVVFNNNFQCFLGIADNLAEVAAHELGHGIGFGHSAVSDATMRATAYGNGRGPRLGDDDRDAAHCHYPHAFTITSPNGGESWAAGSAQNVTWTVTAESGTSASTVNIEYSTDAGATWTVASAGEANDGSAPWTVPSIAGTRNLVRVVRHNRVSPTPSPYPEACSQDVSNSAFTITAAPALTAGTAGDGDPGSPLTLAKGAGGNVTLAWGASCSGTATNYAIYEGTLSALRSGTWNHVARTCAAGTDLAETIAPGSDSVYYLVAPVVPGAEGRLGTTSAGAERPASASACAPRETTSCS